MNKRSTLLSVLGHTSVVALVFLWGLQWPFAPEELKIEKVDVINNAQFDALIQQSSKKISEAVTPEEQPTSSLIAEENIPEEKKPEELKPIVDETIVPAEIISNNPIRDPKPKKPVTEEVVTPKAPQEEVVVEQPKPPKPVPTSETPPIGDAAPRRAVAPPDRPNELALTAPQKQPEGETSIDDLLGEVLTEATPKPEVAPKTPEPTKPEPVSEVPAPKTPTPPARVETELKTESTDTVKKGDNQTTDPAQPEEPKAEPVTPKEEAKTETQEPAEVEQTPATEEFVSKVGPTNAPPARDQGSLNVTDARPVAPQAVEEVEAPKTEEATPKAEEQATEGDSVDALLEEVVKETGGAEAKPKKPEASPEDVAPEPTDTTADAILQDIGETPQSPTSSRDLSRIETNAIIQKIAKNWSISTIADKPNLDQLIVKVRFVVDSEGNMANPVILLEPQDPSEDQKAAFRAADRAIRNSLPLDLPAEVDPSGVKWTLTFDPTAQTVGIN